MKINLADIPEEGRTFTWNSQTAEITADLSDLIGKAEYQTEFFIKPLTTKDFDLTGFIKTKLPEQCARCGIDFAFPINEKFHEILIPKQSQPRGGKYSKVNHVSDLPEGRVESVEYEDLKFNMGEYLHEIVGLAAPFIAAGPLDQDEKCTICEISVKDHNFGYDEVMPEDKPQNAFAALKNMKIN